MLEKNSNTGLFKNCENNDKKNEEINKEIIFLKKRNEELLRRYDTLNSRVNALNHSNSDLNGRNNKLITMLSFYESENYEKDIKIKKLKKQNDELLEFKNSHIFYNNKTSITDVLYIDFDIFLYESNYKLEKQVEYYEKQIDIINETLKDNNINSFSEFKTIILKSNINYKYDNILYLLDKLDEDINHQKITENKIINDFDDLNIRIKNIRSKLRKIKEGDIILIKGIKRKAIYINGKLKLCKIENVFNKIKMLEENVNNFCTEQILWAKSVIGNEYSDDKIIKLLDILNK